MSTLGYEKLGLGLKLGEVLLIESFTNNTTIVKAQMELPLMLAMFHPVPAVTY